MRWQHIIIRSAPSVPPPILAAAAADLTGPEIRNPYLCELHRQAAVRLAMTGGNIPG